MSYSKSTLSLVTVLLLFGLLGGGVAWRLWGGEGDGSEDASASAQADPSGVVVESAEQFSPSMPQAVSGAEAVQDTLWIPVRAAGQAEAYRRTTLTAQVSGVVRSLPVRENVPVSQGTSVLQIDTTEYALALAQARAGHLAAEADFQQLTLFDDDASIDPAVREERRRIARTRSGLDAAEVSLRQAELDMERTRVAAPFEGRVADLQVVAGQHVGSGAELMTIVDLNPIKVEVQVLEGQLGLLSEGRGAEVTFAAYPGEVFRGRIESMNPMVDPETRAGRVTVVVDNPRDRIKPGMYAEVSLDAEALPDRVMIPVAALLERDYRPVVFAYEERDGVGRAMWRYVNPGRRNDTHVELLREGSENGFVEPGETVLVDGHHYLGHDVAVRLVDDVEAAGGRPSR